VFVRVVLTVSGSGYFRKDRRTDRTIVVLNHLSQLPVPVYPIIEQNISGSIFPVLASSQGKRALRCPLFFSSQQAPYLSLASSFQCVPGYNDAAFAVSTAFTIAGVLFLFLFSPLHQSPTQPTDGKGKCQLFPFDSTDTPLPLLDVLPLFCANLSGFLSSSPFRHAS